MVSCLQPPPGVGNLITRGADEGDLAQEATKLLFLLDL